MEILSDAVGLYSLLDDSKFVIQPESAEVLSWPITVTVLNKWKELISDFKGQSLTEADFLRIESDVKNSTGAKGKTLFQPIRVAVIGRPQGPELKMLVPLMATQSLIARVNQVLKNEVSS
jgi:nondiscriminating glutamyl-tRNA synthetase